MDPRFYVLTPAGLSGPYPNSYEAGQVARIYRFPVIVRKGARADDEPSAPTCPCCGGPMEDDTPCQYDPADPCGPAQCPDDESSE